MGNGITHAHQRKQRHQRSGTVARLSAGCGSLRLLPHVPALSIKAHTAADPPLLLMLASTCGLRQS